jgi:hypothetical protein
MLTAYLAGEAAPLLAAWVRWGSTPGGPVSGRT